MTTRRGFFSAVAAGTVTAWLSAHAAELRAAGAFAAAAAPADPYLVLTPEQVALLDAVTATLIPTDDLPGAREAHVVRFIDRTLTTVFKNERDAFEKALGSLGEQTALYAPDAANFVALEELDRIAVLEQFEQADPDAFGAIRQVTIAGMFSVPSYGGNFQKAGWKMLGFDDRFIWTPPFGYYDRG